MKKLKDERLQLRINAEDKKLMQIRAIELGISLADYITKVCIEEIERNKNSK